ncbi:hypothetical protein WOB89_22985 [Vibrio parahaemolyticus]|uniref:hypothetical protein n=1 Tax=Vibrio parahaemolyticus TaxID=670 RepID=UPI000A3BA1BF|nr:hypothetical protein [Vibrio parahaemolyticus]OUJ32249.1 hypothetical protein BTR40_25155 [Vibrio parahaemolyticus]
MNILVTPPEMHFDKGLGISAWRFRDAAKVLIDSGNSKDLLSPIGYLQRHALELYLKSLIYILHKKYNIAFGGDFSLDNPAIFANGKWRPMSNTHNLDDLYSYFKSIYDSNFENLPKTTDWTLSDTLGKQIKLISGYDPKSTYFRYPKAASASQDQKKSTIQPMDIESALKDVKSGVGKPIKCAVMLDANDNVVQTYNLVPEVLEDVRIALSEAMDYINNLHCAFLGELTKWS